MEKKKNNNNKPNTSTAGKIRFNLTHTVLSAVLIILIILAYQVILLGKFYPFTYIGDTQVSLLTRLQASNLLSANWQKRLDQTLTFTYSEGSEGARQYFINIASTGAQIDYSIIGDVFQKQHSGNIFNNLLEQIKSIIDKTIVSTTIKLNISTIAEEINKDISKNPTSAALTYTETANSEGTPSAVINITEGVDGIALNKERLELQIKNYLNFGNYNPLLPTNTIKPDLTGEDLAKTKKILQYLFQYPLKLHFQTRIWEIDAKQLITILNMASGVTLLDKKKALQYIGKIASDIDQKVSEGQFEFDASLKRVSVFKPSQEGRQLDPEKTYELINSALENQTGNIDLPVEIIKPKVQTSEINNLGIKELIGRGISNFAGSIPNRIFNVALTASKINGTLIAPGDIFSFNQTIGDISAATGFKQAYVIKEGRTVLDDGGGVCQDSTTLFRAVLNAGLPVIKRTAHAYRVGYYEQGFPPGLDATVYYPSVDFQFKNDTNTHILIQAYTSGLTLYVDLYGTGDGRIVNLTKSVVTNITPAPPELRQEDPTLPRGQIKQVDWAAAGATVKFKRIVAKNGENIINETWTSNYKPWQAVYLVGTQ